MAVPAFNPAGSRYDQSSFQGRLTHFREMTDPRTLLVDDKELQSATTLLDAYSKGDRSASDADLWNAKRIRDAIIHPVTGEKMFLPGRMSAFVPANTIPTAGMLLARTPAQTVFWQWINQSVNVMCNCARRGARTSRVGPTPYSRIGAMPLGVLRRPAHSPRPPSPRSRLYTHG